MPVNAMFAAAALGAALMLAGCGESPSGDEAGGASNTNTPSVLDEPVTEENMEDQLDALEKQINAPIEP